MTAGSCFAQHIARYLGRFGFHTLITEDAHPIASAEIAEAFHYGMFSARYGNIYTARQLLQLFQRAFGHFDPVEDMWEQDGIYLDPYRPRIQPGGFASEREYLLDRDRHFAAVRRAFEDLDIFIFTLGLTESWRSRRDGAVFPLCPGVGGGQFDEQRHEFHNFTVEEIASDLLQFMEHLGRINSRAKVILTVSPVPLVATAEPRHVLVSTTYSKSVLRVACETVCSGRTDVIYFPSYEIVTGSFSRGAYFGPDCRSVTEEAVNHVMGVFFRHFTTAADFSTLASQPRSDRDRHLEEMEKIVAVICEEEMLDRQNRRRRGRRRKGRRSLQT